MHQWTSQFSHDELERLAKRLEHLVTKAHNTLVWTTASPDTVEAFALAQAKLLGFDEYTLRKFRESLENQRVKTLAQGNLFLTAILTAAVALRTAKEAPRSLQKDFATKGRNFLLEHSTSGLALLSFALSSFYAVLGQGALFRIKSCLAQAQKTVKPKN